MSGRSFMSAPCQERDLSKCSNPALIRSPRRRLRRASWPYIAPSLLLKFNKFHDPCRNNDGLRHDGNGVTFTLFHSLNCVVASREFYPSSIFPNHFLNAVLYLGSIRP